MADRWKHRFLLWYYFDIAGFARGKKIYKKFPKTFFLSTFISIAVPPVLNYHRKSELAGGFLNHSNCLYMRTKQLALAYRDPGSGISSDLIFQNIAGNAKCFQVGSFLGGGTAFFPSPNPPVPPFLRFFSDFFRFNSCTILPYPPPGPGRASSEGQSLAFCRRCAKLWKSASSAHTFKTRKK